MTRTDVPGGTITTTASGKRRKQRGRTPKLPKMTNSERGKYYRHKYKQYESRLEDSVVKLRKQVRDLRMFLDIREELAYRTPYDSTGSIVASIYEYFLVVRDGLKLDSSFRPPQEAISPMASSSASIFFPDPFPAHETGKAEASTTYRWEECSEYHTFLFFDLVSFGIEGGYHSPVVILKGTLHTVYSRSTIENLFPHALDQTYLMDQLLDKEIQYPCTYHFYFSADGVLHDKIVEADFVHGLQQVLGRLEDVMWLLAGSHRLKTRQNSLEDVLRGPSPMAIDFLLS
ncbi:TPA: hypothetical protein N0F65_011938 [Lagenidium giganteum]|uniref:Uncharacterized protein n=1 Tax=Lagenidium giganteum TaxID=4803 RepID=A0AAV2Z8D7_9STRA|nr:TPA: hypothetical protein N0F65_011938 [Lagenidium giganteum]